MSALLSSALVAKLALYAKGAAPPVSRAEWAAVAQVVAEAAAVAAAPGGGS